MTAQFEVCCSGTTWRARTSEAGLPYSVPGSHHSKLWSFPGHLCGRAFERPVKLMAGGVETERDEPERAMPSIQRQLTDAGNRSMFSCMAGLELATNSTCEQI